MGTEIDEVVKFIFELGHLKNIKHEGWRCLNISNPSSVAAHSCRAAQIAFVLARMEGYPDPYEACAKTVFHDMAETRVGDLHKLAARYAVADEHRSARDSTNPLGELGKELYKAWEDVEEQNTTAGLIGKDADVLEVCFQAKTYVDLGVKDAYDWIKNSRPRLKTKSAKAICEALLTADSNEWWKGWKKIPKD